MQILEEPRLVTEQEDVTLLRMFGFSTKPNEHQKFAYSKENGHQKAQEFIDKDFCIIPERIFKPLEEGRGGHVASSSYEEELEQIKKHSHGKIVKLYGPIYYNDGSGNYKYDFGVKLSGSKASSILLENGPKTWVPFAVSPHTWVTAGQPIDDIKDYTPMGTFLVIKGDYGQEATIKKMCSGSELKCGTSLASAIANIGQHDVSEVLNSFIGKIDTPKHNMATVLEQKPNEVPSIPTVPEIKEQVKDEQITLTKQEYDTVQSQLKEQEELRKQVADLQNERNLGILDKVFGSIESEEIRNTLTEKYMKTDVKLVKSVFDDLVAHYIPIIVKNELEKNKKETIETAKSGSSKASSTTVLKPEPKRDTNKDESKASSIVPNNVNEVLVFSKMFDGDVI